QGRHARELPQQLAVAVVGADALRAGRHDFGAQRIAPHEWRGPALMFLAGDFPQLLAGARVERNDERLLGVVVDDVEAVAVDGGGAAGAELRAAGERAELV